MNTMYYVLLEVEFANLQQKQSAHNFSLQNCNCVLNLLDHRGVTEPSTYRMVPATLSMLRGLLKSCQNSQETDSKPTMYLFLVWDLGGIFYWDRYCKYLADHKKLGFFASGSTQVIVFLL